MGIAEFIIGPAEGRTRWLNLFYELEFRQRGNPISGDAVLASAPR